MLITDPRLGTDGTSTASCTLCGLTGSDKEVADHNCLRNPDDIVPSRFDPYEALDRIEGLVNQGKWYTTPVKTDLHALRTYITGMERAS